MFNCSTFRYLQKGQRKGILLVDVREGIREGTPGTTVIKGNLINFYICNMES